MRILTNKVRCNACGNTNTYKIILGKCGAVSIGGGLNQTIRTGTQYTDLTEYCDVTDYVNKSSIDNVLSDIENDIETLTLKRRAEIGITLSILEEYFEEYDTKLADRCNNINRRL